MKIPNADNFRYQEFFSPAYFEKWKGTPYYLINSISPKLPLLAQFLKDRHGGKPVIINNWLWRSENDYPYDYSGFRDRECREGSKVSRHRLGLCIDVKVIDIEPVVVQTDIKDNFDLFSDHGLTAIEADTKTWTHISVENIDWRHQEGLWVIPNPNVSDQNEN